MRIAIIGTGKVGGTLGRRWAGAGHEVIFCSRSPQDEKVKALLAASGRKARSAHLTEGVAGAEVVVLAMPGEAALETIDSAGSLAGKVVIDCTNSVTPDLYGLRVGGGPSAAERIAERAPGARVVKGFNTCHFTTMDDPSFGGTPADLFLCGDDEAARSTVAGLAREIGFEVVDAGPLASALHLEYLAGLWINLAFKQGQGTDITFKLLRR